MFTSLICCIFVFIELSIFLNFLLGLPLWFIDHLEICCLVSKCSEFLCYLSNVLHLAKEYSLYNFSHSNLFYDPEYGLSWHVYYGQLTMCILVWGGMSYSWASRLSAEGTCQYLDVTAAFFPCVLSHGKGFIYVGSSVLYLTSLEFRSIECRRVAWYIHNL